MRFNPSATKTENGERRTENRPRNWLTIAAVTLLLSAMGIQMTLAALHDSATSDEQIHILSGYATLTQHHILFDPEHPFLAKALSVIPLLFVKPTMPYASTHLTPVQAQVIYNTYRQANVWGFEFLFTSGNNPYLLLNLARGVIILLTLALGLLIFLWTKANLGTPAALAALTFYAFDPTFIAHGHLANDDTVAALFFVAALMTFQWHLTKPTIKSTAITGLILGLGLITKFSLLALGPTFIAIAVIHHFLQKRTSSASDPSIESRQRDAANTRFKQPGAARQGVFWLGCQTARRHAFSSALALWHSGTLPSHPRTLAISLLAIFLTAWAVIWASYGALFLLNPAQNPLFVDYHTVYAAAPPHTHIPTPNSLTGQALNLVGHTLPIMWVKGFALISPTTAGHSREGYLLGQCFRGSHWDYFPVLTLFKMPLPVLIILAISLTTLIVLAIKKIYYQSARWQDGKMASVIPLPRYLATSLPTLRFPLLFLLLPTLIYLFIAAFSDIDIGIRHILPVYALLLILAAWPLSWLSQPSVLRRRPGSGGQERPASSVQPHPNSASRFSLLASRSHLALSHSGTLALFTILFAWLILGTLHAFPNYLPYFNELASEPRPVPYISNDSNIDWGESTKELAQYIQTHHITHLAFDNFIGFGEARYLHLPFAIADPANHQYKGYVAISRSAIIDHLCSKNNDWGWVVDHQTPVAIIGNAINLYYLN